MLKTKKTAEISDLFFLRYNGDFIIDLKTDISVENKNDKSKIRLHYPLTKEFKTLFLEFLLGKGITYKLAEYNNKLEHKPHEDGLGFLNPNCEDGFFKYDNEYTRNEYKNGKFFKKLKEFLALDEKITKLSENVLHKYYSEIAQTHRLDIEAYITKCINYKGVFPKINVDTHLFDFDDIWLKNFIDDYEWNKTFEKLEKTENNLTVKYVNQEEWFVLKITKLFSDKLQSKLQFKIPLLIRGAEGRGKTSLACMFMADAIKDKDKCFYLNFEDDSLLEKLKKTYNKGKEKDNIKAMLDELNHISTNHLIVFDNFHNVEDNFNQNFKLHDKIKLLILERGMSPQSNDNKERKWNNSHFYFLEPNRTEVTEIYNEDVFEKYNKIFQITNSKTEDGEDKIHDYSLLNINISDEENKSGLNLRILHHISKLKEEDVNFNALYDFVREQYFYTEKASEGETTKDYEEIIAQIATINALDCHYEIELTETTKYEKLFKSGLVKKTTSQYNIRFAHQTDAIIILIGYFGNSSQQAHKIDNFLATQLKHYFTETEAINFFGCFMNLYRTKSKVSEYILGSSKWKEYYLKWLVEALKKRTNINNDYYSYAKALRYILSIIKQNNSTCYTSLCLEKLIINDFNANIKQNREYYKKNGKKYLNMIFEKRLLNDYIKYTQSCFISPQYIKETNKDQLDLVLKELTKENFDSSIFNLLLDIIYNTCNRKEYLGLKDAITEVFKDKFSVLTFDSDARLFIFDRFLNHKANQNLNFCDFILHIFLYNNAVFDDYLSKNIVYKDKIYSKLEILKGIVEYSSLKNYNLDKLAKYIQTYLAKISSDIFPIQLNSITEEQQNQLAKLYLLIEIFEENNHNEACKTIVSCIDISLIKNNLNNCISNDITNNNINLMLHFGCLHFYKTTEEEEVDNKINSQNIKDILNALNLNIKNQNLANVRDLIKIIIYLNVEINKNKIEKLDVKKCLAKEDMSFYKLLELLNSNIVLECSLFNQFKENILTDVCKFNTAEFIWIYETSFKNENENETYYLPRTLCLAYVVMIYKCKVDPFIIKESNNFKRYSENEKNYPIPKKLKDTLKSFHKTINVAEKLAENKNFKVKTAKK
ncbi:MAG: hypothetical protein EAZ53_15570 [Bacteroidetes bacterium]|nr:MAG: hypothetical protein EAZ53_15570 [Bacteroidota bacterium]